MADHVRILIFSSMLISGFSLQFYLNQVYRLYPYNFIRAIKQYNIALIVLYLVRIIGVYIEKNISHDVGSIFIPILVQTLEIVYVILVISLYYLLLNILLNLRDKAFTKGQNRWMLFIASVFIVIYYTRFFIPEIDTLFRWMEVLKSKYGIINLIINSTEVLALIGFYFFWGDHKLDIERIRLSKIFIILYIICDLLAIVSQICVAYLSIPEIPSLIIYTLNASLYLLAIFIWVKSFFIKYARNISSLINKSNQFKSTYLEYKITKRESEIIELLMAGKSVSEVADLLFISQHTVKNHITHIYEKLNVKTRYEFINLFVQKSLK